jgi:hypothetical protein
VVDTVSPQPFVILMTRLGEIATVSVGVVCSPGGVTSFLLLFHDSQHLKTACGIDVGLTAE